MLTVLIRLVRSFANVLVLRVGKFHRYGSEGEFRTTRSVVLSTFAMSDPISVSIGGAPHLLRQQSFLPCGQKSTIDSLTSYMSTISKKILPTKPLAKHDTISYDKHDNPHVGRECRREVDLRRGSEGMYRQRYSFNSMVMKPIRISVECTVQFEYTQSTLVVRPDM